MVIPDQIAFHAVAYSNSGPGVVIFDHVISNIGSRYDSSSGIFTVPTTGFYVFSWSIETYEQLTEAALLVNGIEIRISKSDEIASYYDTITSFAILILIIKGKVWDKVKSGRAEAMQTMFSGWIINQRDSTAFYASITHDEIGYSIKFNNEVLDTDDDYSRYTGSFGASFWSLRFDDVRSYVWGYIFLLQVYT
ncbi:complement C1q and tumor necrosis factor-related protein 9A-like [Saccostrea cucullata]|uniref:complement C1q and tumor necrosis factor-related protein 9A-like n=1 Tax=Saccostrea cuccullata TaxID=36930 RepID=UPI002ED2A323